MDGVELVAADGIRLDAVLSRPARCPVGAVVLAHGITADLDEGGMYAHLADRLAEWGFAVLRFSFRGHGRSGGGQRGVTIAGESLDLQAAVERAEGVAAGDVGVVASSFGAVSAALSVAAMPERVRGVAWWNPILDLRHTFLEPQLPWGRKNFGVEQQRLLRSHGFLTVDGAFELGRVLFAEFAVYDRLPYTSFTSTPVPALVVHGDRDGAVSYDIARAAAAEHPEAVFHTVAGADHGFDGREGAEDEAIAVTVDWMSRLFGVAP